MAKKYKKSKRRKNRTSLKEIEKGAIVILKKDGVLMRDTNNYLVSSLSEKGMYHQVQHKSGYWSCTCKYRSFHTTCKHIRAVQMQWNKKPVKRRNVTRTEINPPKVHCTSCKDSTCHQTTDYETKRGKVPVYMCDQCGDRFVFRPGFKKRKFSDDFIVACLLLLSMGLPAPRTAEYMLEKERTRVDPSTIYRWAKKYASLVTDFTKTLPFQVGDNWDVDELYILTYPEGSEKECMYWAFVMTDRVTGLTLAYKVAPNKPGFDATDLFAESIKIAKKTPKVLTSDKLYGFKKGFANTMEDTGALHIADVGINGVHVNNNRQERLNGEIKECIGRARGYRSADPPRIKLAFVYLNFIHETNGVIPAEAAGIFTMGNKLKTLIQNAALACT